MEMFTEKRYMNERPCGCVAEDILFYNKDGEFCHARANRISGCSFHGMYGAHTNF